MLFILLKVPASIPDVSANASFYKSSPVTTATREKQLRTI
jgi:hypothetical protein